MEEKVKQYLLDSYEEKSSYALSKELNIPASTIRSFWNRQGLKNKKFFSPNLQIFSEDAKKMSITELSRKYKRDRHTISNFVKQNNISVKECKHFLTKEQKEYCIKHYLDKTSYELAEYFGVAQSTIHKIWKENNLSGKPAKRIYPLKESYFEEIDTDEKAYYLGLLASDGCVSEVGTNKGQNIIKIQLAYEDKAILESFAKELNTKKPIRTVVNKKNRKYCSIELSSNKMFNDLCKYGIKPRKTYSLTFPVPNLPEKFYYAYLRGYFDGDGTISKTIDFNKLSNVNIEYCGFFNNMNGIKEHLETKGIESHLYIDKRSKNAEQPFCKLRFSNKKDQINFIKYIYNNNKSKIFLKRKYDLCQKFLKAVKENPKNHKKVNIDAVLNSDI